MSAPAHEDKLSQTERQALEKWLKAFQSAWDENRFASQVRGLSAVGSPFRHTALRELIKFDLRRQWQHGKRARLEAYLKAYPELGTPDCIFIRGSGTMKVVGGTGRFSGAMGSGTFNVLAEVTGFVPGGVTGPFALRFEGDIALLGK